MPGWEHKRERKSKRGESVSTKRERKSKGGNQWPRDYARWKHKERGKVKEGGISECVKEQPLLLFFLQVPALSVQVAWGVREENWEGGAGLWGLALLPLEFLILVLLLCAQREEVKELENREEVKGN